MKTIALLVLFIAMLFTGHVGLTRLEKTECATWQEINKRDFDSQAYDDWQIKQCKHYNIHLDIK